MRMEMRMRMMMEICRPFFSTSEHHTSIYSTTVVYSEHHTD
jgi:hypothetical protein